MSGNACGLILQTQICALPETSGRWHYDDSSQPPQMVLLRCRLRWRYDGAHSAEMASTDNGWDMIAGSSRLFWFRWQPANSACCDLRQYWHFSWYIFVSNIFLAFFCFKHFFGVFCFKYFLDLFLLQIFQFNRLAASSAPSTIAPWSALMNRWCLHVGQHWCIDGVYMWCENLSK